jgi:type IV secretory pathway VirD2 relaxase
MKMEKLFRQIGDEIVEYTDEEYKQLEIDKTEDKKRELEALAKERAKAALLEKLGITADEANLLLS